MSFRVAATRNAADRGLRHSELTGFADDIGALTRPSLDGFELAFRQGLANGLGPDTGHLVTRSFPTVRGVQCRVEVKPAPMPVFLVGKGVPPDSPTSWRTDTR